MTNIKKMKKKLFIAAAILVTPMLARAACEDMMTAWMNELHPGRSVDTERSACKAWPANPQLTLAAMTLPHDDESGAVDLEVLVADSASGTIVAHRYQPNAITDDAIRFSDIALDTARYQLTPAIRAFGVRVSHEGASRPNPYGETSLSLYVLEGDTLRPVLDSIAVDHATGEWNMRCEGSYDSTTRTIAMGPAGRDGYASLKIAEKTVHSDTRMVKDECVSKEAAPKQSSVMLEYRNGRYSVPKSMQAGS